jgi:uncharacterized Tic20 family protein
MEENNQLEPSQPSAKQTTSPHEFRPWGMEHNQFCTFLHLSQFAGMVVPMAGIVLPIVMWTSFKDESEAINQNGKNVLNWMISSIIYIFISIILCFFIIGIFTLFAVIICSIVFTIQGAIKASRGEVYFYPMAITFIK